MRRLFGQRLLASVGSVTFLVIASVAAVGQSGTDQAGSAQASSKQTSSAQTSSAQGSAAQNSSAQSSAAPASSTQSTVVSSPANQSLGDIARQNRAKKGDTASSTATTKVITNADLPKNPDGYSEPEPPANSEAAAGSNQKLARSAGARKAAGARPVNPQVAAMWRNRILAQKAAIAGLQGQIDELRAGMDYLNPGRGDPGANKSTVAFSPGEARRAARLHTMEQRLETMKQRLDETEDAAREAGMDSKVFDP